MCRAGGVELGPASPPLGFSRPPEPEPSFLTPLCPPGERREAERPQLGKLLGAQAGGAGPRRRDPACSGERCPRARGPAPHEMKPSANSSGGMMAAFIQVTSEQRNRKSAGGAAGMQADRNCPEESALRGRSPEGERRPLYRRKWMDRVFNVPGALPASDPRRPNRHGTRRWWHCWCGYGEQL